MLRRLYSAAALIVCSVLHLNAQVGSGSLQGVVKDKKTGEPLPFVSVVVENKGTRVAGGQTDFDGNYTIKPIDPGTYDVTISYVGYQPQKTQGVVINSNKITFLNMDLNSGVDLKEVEVVRYKVPLIDKDGGASGSTVTRDQIARMPARSATSIATTVAGASDAGTGGGISIRGARTENTYYYIDGVKVPAGAGTGLPKAAIEEVQVITGGVPANYGDVTGGLVNITTRGPSRAFFGSVEYLTSGYKLGDDITDIVGLDKYAFNQLEASLSGPLFFKKDSLGNRDKPLLGFFLSGQATDVVDGSPLYTGDYRVNPSKREELLNDPLRLAVVGTQVVSRYNTNYLRASDLEHLDTRQNAGSRSYLGSLKFDVATTPTINLTFGGSVDFQKYQAFDRNNSLLNAENNTQVRDLSYRGFVRFTQRFSQREESTTEGAQEKKGGIKNAFYSLQVDYSRRDRNVEDPEHQNRLFDYGYVGKYQRFRAPTYALHTAAELGDSTYWVQTGFRDTLVTYVPGDVNPELATMTSQFFNLFPREAFPIELLYGAQNPAYVGYYQNYNEIQTRSGLLNGSGPANVYSLWNNIGLLSNTYSKFEQEQVRISATGSADIGKHAVSLGLEYEQLTQRSYDLAPVGLWGRARALANFHLQELNLENHTSVENYFGTVPFYNYDRLVGSDQNYFDRKLREALGLNPNGTDFVDVDALDPGTLNLSMFSADDLINEGNGLISEPGGIVGYYGYDHLGKKLTSKPSFEDFFNQFDVVDGDTVYSRLQAPFQPIYVAGYVMDKFTFDDIIFNLGVRVDRYDANQYVLKDKYLWRPAYTAGDGAVQSLYAPGQSRPSNIGDDYVVYVDNKTNPTQVVGYRDGDRWYNAQGEVLNDPSVLRSADGIQPYLINYDSDPKGSLNGSNLRQEAFKPYDPQVNVMPRVAFSFPISDEAVFFAHYDILTQRPTSNSRLNLLEYAFIQNTNNTLPNPALKPTRTTDFELGFQQVLSKSSSLKLSAYYRELRDQIQIRNVTEAWPQTYKTYDNIDFGTVKGFTVSYDLRRTGNISMRAAYTLQFADGTGSDPGTSLALLNANQPNLRTISPLNFDQRHRFQVNVDFRYGSGSDYNGPMLFGKKILQDLGINFISILGSGTPYSLSSRVTKEGDLSGGGSNRLVGSINGARLPWQFTTDMQIDRNLVMKFGEKKEGGESKAKNVNLNIYLLVTNVFNTENIVGVYRATGSPTDDGYLADPTYQNDINLQVDSQSYRELYALKVNNPFNYGAPRTIRLGFRFDF